MTEEHAHSLQESDLDHHEADPDQGEIDGAADGQLPAGFSDRRPQWNDDRSGDERDRNQNEHGEGQRRDEVSSDHPGVSEMREQVRIEQGGESQLIKKEGARIGRRREVEIEAGRRLVERATTRSTDDLLQYGGGRRRV